MVPSVVTTEVERVHVIVGGCGRLGAEIATTLSAGGDDVIVIDVDPDAFDRLGAVFNGDVVEGRVTDREVLERAGIDTTDALVAVTRYDNANLMAVEIATHLYGVTRSVARLFNPEREGSYRRLGVRYVSATGLLAKQFLNELRHGTFRHHVRFETGDVEIVEMRVAERGLTVAALEIRGRLRVAAVQRGDRVSIPGPDDRLEPGDLVVASAVRGTYASVARLIEQDTHEHVVPEAS